MRGFFEGIQYLFEQFLFAPHNFLRKLELTSWWGANIINWLLFIICFVAMVYWCMKLKEHADNGEENQDTTAHSFLK
jgi:hypothetical protein